MKNQVRKYVERYVETPETEAIYDILRSITARGGALFRSQKVTVEFLGVAMKLNEKGELAITPRDILEIDRHWTVAEKNVLTDVMVS